MNPQGPIESKLRTADELEPLLGAARARGQVIAHCHGSFDILHPGHFRHLAWAKAQGDVLVVSIASDRFVRDELHVPNLVPEALRAENLANLHVVDYVVIHDGRVSDLLDRFRPDIYVKGSEFVDVRDGPFGRERELVESYGGKLSFSSGDVVYSDAELVERKLRSILPLDEQARQFCQRHGITPARVQEILQETAHKRVLIVGEVIVDEYLYCDPLGMSADSPTLVVRPSHSDMFLGAAGIVAQHVAAMGATPYYCSVVGQDSQADFAREQLERRGIDHHLVVDETRPTIHKKRYVAHGKKLLNVNVFRDQDLSRNTEKRLIEAIESHGDGVDAVIISDFSYGVVTPAVVEALLAIRGARDIPVVGDVQSSSQVGCVTRLKGLTLSTPSEREARLALWDRESGIADLGVGLLEETRNAALLITLGDTGLMVFDTAGRSWEDITRVRQLHAIKSKLTIEYLPSFAQTVVDALGAGDAMLAAATSALAAGASVMEAAYIGNAASAVEVAHMGNIPVSSSELTDVIAAQLSAR